MSFLREVQLGNEFGAFVVLQEALGFIPNLLRAQTLLPRVIEAQAKLEMAVRPRQGAISSVQKERMLLSVAANREDSYCVALESKVLSSLGVPDSQLDDFLNDYIHAGLSAPDLACLQFCIKLSRHALSISSKDIEVLRAWGFEDESILEAVFVTALAVYRCTLSVGLAPEPDFGSRKCPSTRFDPPHKAVVEGLSPKAHTTDRKGPYVSAPYLSPKRFAPFSIVQQSHGFIPNFFRAQTLRPDLLGAELEAEGRILQPEDVLTRMQKECILLAVSAANLNSYCVAVHCNLLRGLGMPPEEGDQIAVDHHQSGLSEADKALVDFALKLGTRAAEFTRDDIVRLQAFGFTEEQILECEVVTALNNFANTLQMGLGIEPDFEPPLAFQENKVYLPAVTRHHTTDGGVAPASDRAQDPDAGLVAEAQGGKLEAFEELSRRHSRLIYRALTAILGSPVDAQDAMQDTLLSAFQHIGGFQGRSKFSTWLVSIARNTALQRLRQRIDFESLDEGRYEEDQDFRPRQVIAWEDNPEQHYSRLETRQLIEKAILELPAKYRLVLVLRDIEKRSTDEVARQLGLSVPTVKVRLLRGRLMLREWLSPHFTISLTRAAR